MLKGAHIWTPSEPETIQSTLAPCEIFSFQSLNNELPF
jgi:hypothetical protein